MAMKLFSGFLVHYTAVIMFVVYLCTRIVSYRCTALTDLVSMDAGAPRTLLLPKLKSWRHVLTALYIRRRMLQAQAPLHNN